MNFEQWLQSRLTAHRCPVGAIDGNIGPTTIAAIKAFQASKGLEVTGTANGTTIDHLRMPSSTIMPEIKAQIPDRDASALETHQPSKIIWPRQDDVPAFYGAVGTNQTSIEIPFDMFLAWDKSARVRKITLHQKVAASGLAAFESIAKTYSEKERVDLGINIFGGSLNVRRMRGGTRYSMHSWGIAIDFDPERNGLHVHKPEARLSHPDAVAFWLAWEAQGWLSLGRAKDFDWMHIQAARL